MPEVSKEQLVQWAAVATLADSYMSLVYHRGGITRWDTPATPQQEDWAKAMDKARRASNDLRTLLKQLNVDDHAVAREMNRESWIPVEVLT